MVGRSVAKIEQDGVDWRLKQLRNTLSKSDATKNTIELQKLENQEFNPENILTLPPYPIYTYLCRN